MKRTPPRPGDATRSRAAAQAVQGDCLYVYSARPARAREASGSSAAGRGTRTLVWDTYWDGELEAHAFAQVLALAEDPRVPFRSVRVDGVRTRLIADDAHSPAADPTDSQPRATL